MAAGVSGGLAALGGWLMRNSPATTKMTTVPAVGESTAPTKRCPDCAETVLAEARLCKHCRYRFAGAP